MSIQDRGTLISAIGTSVELIGVVWLALGLVLGLSRIRKAYDEGVRVMAEAADRRATGELPESIKEWQNAELRRLGALRGTWNDLHFMPMVVQLNIARDQARNWKGGAALVFAGLIFDVIGSWMQAA